MKLRVLRSIRTTTYLGAFFLMPGTPVTKHRISSTAKTFSTAGTIKNNLLKPLGSPVSTSLAGIERTDPLVSLWQLGLPLSHSGSYRSSRDVRNLSQNPHNDALGPLHRTSHPQNPVSFHSSLLTPHLHQVRHPARRTPITSQQTCRQPEKPSRRHFPASLCSKGTA